MKATKAKIKSLEIKINKWWDSYSEGQSTEQVDKMQQEITALRDSLIPPVSVGKNWCTSDGQWWI